MSKSKKQIRVGDLVKLNRELFQDENYYGMIKSGQVSMQTAQKHLFNDVVELSASPPGFNDEPDRTTCVMEYKDVAMVLEFSDSSRLSTKILTSHGWGWLPTAYLESA